VINIEEKNTGPQCVKINPAKLFEFHLILTNVQCKIIKGKGHPITGHQGPREGVQI
jgi:hypothetical protein